jgi:hypothetical protein
MTETSKAPRTTIDPQVILVNHDQTIHAVAGEFMVCQRNEGYAENDGQWTVHLLPELYWSAIGTLRQRRAGRFVGVFPTIDDAQAAIAAADAEPVADKMVR